MEPTDRILLLRTHRGHEPSARVLWERHAPRLRAHAAALVGAAHADDAVQEVFCRVLTLRRRRVRAVADVPAFLATLTRRVAMNMLRGQARRRRRERARAAPEERRPAAVGEGALHAALERLPRRAREVVVLKHAAGLTFDQLALALGINRNTAASRYRSAMDDLRRLMEVSPAGPGAACLLPARAPGTEVACG